MFIGIVTFPKNPKLQNYIHWVKQAGATPVVIKTPDVDLTHIQGFVWVGGSLETIQPASMRTFLETLRKTFNHAVAQNRAGISFPIWGVCLGFQLLALVRSGSLSKARNAATRKIHLRGRLATAVRDLRPNSMVGLYNHKYGLRPPYPSYLTPTSEETDAQGPFLTSFQFKKYPFYGTTWHPEHPPQQGKEFGRRLGEFFSNQIKRKRVSAASR